MKRIIGIMIGLSLGWLAAGYVMAEPQNGHEVAEAAHGGHAEHAATAVSQITHDAVGGAPWLTFVLVFAVGLFGAAVFVNLMGWAKPQPMEQDDDEHGHDDHH